ncbi:MAG: SIS domain-containing protein [Algoriphagus sp.]|nr:SIS domain-containing protein [Algoriphagus sp.]
MAPKAFIQYKDLIFQKLKKAFAQENQILQAAQMIAESLGKGGWIYISGTGHSHMFAEEIFYRAGGFARVIPILDSALMLHESASKSTEIERKEGYAAEIMKPYTLTENDIFIIASNSGRNAVSIELALHANSKGAKTICITNLAHSNSVESRHSSNKKLFQIADLFLDNCGEIGDAGISIPGLSLKVGATSTVIGVAILQAIMVQAATILVEYGIRPEVFNSSNSNEGEEENDALLAKYKPMVKIL